MTDQPSIYDMLAKTPLEQVTITNINAAMGRSITDTASFEFWQGVIMLQHALQSGRTMAMGNLPIPETGKVLQTTIADSSSATVKPTAPEIWRVEAIDRDSVDIFLFDGTAAVNINSKTEPFYITNTLYISYSNSAGSEKNPTIAYTKVSL